MQSRVASRPTKMPGRQIKTICTTRHYHYGNCPMLQPAILAAGSRDRGVGVVLLFFSLFLLVLLNKLRLEVAGYEFIAGELHDKRGAAASERAERGGVG